MGADIIADEMNFNPRPPCGGRHCKSKLHRRKQIISIHVPRVEDDTARPRSRVVCRNFNPRPPCGGRQRTLLTDATSSRNISIHVPRVEDDILHKSGKL